MRRPPISTLFPYPTLSRSVWAPYYTFGDEPHLPAGARVRVYAGNAVGAPPQEPGLVQRFVATGTDSGQLRLPPERSEEHTSELQSRQYLVCRLLLEKKKIT